MRILKISDVYFPRVNGVSTSIRTFSHELLQQGHEVTLVAPRYPNGFEDGFEILRVPSRYLFLDPEDRLMRRRALRRYLPELRADGYDVVHVHTPFAAHYAGLEIGRLLDLPVIETYHTYFEEYLDKYLTWLPRSALRYVARRFSRSQCAAVDALIVPTQPMLDVLRGYGIRKRAEIIPTGIPDGAFSAGDGSRFRERHAIDAQREVMLYVGRVAHEKNIDFLVEVVDRVRHARPSILLVIAGEGPAVKHLRELTAAKRLEEHVRFVGYLGRERDLPDCYAAADLFTFASRTETQGLVLLEAMQAGTPVVSTAVMGTAEVMADRRGGLVAQEDADDFAASVERLLADRTLREHLAVEAVQKAAEWSAPATTDRLLKLYRDCIGHTAATPDRAHTTGPLLTPDATVRVQRRNTP